jgi:hypothetical protein
MFRNAAIHSWHNLRSSGCGVIAGIHSRVDRAASRVMQCASDVSTNLLGVVAAGGVNRLRRRSKIGDHWVLQIWLRCALLRSFLSSVVLAGIVLGAHISPYFLLSHIMWPIFMKSGMVRRRCVMQRAGARSLPPLRTRNCPSHLFARKLWSSSTLHTS